MSPPSQAVRDLARQLLEASRSAPSSPRLTDQQTVHDAVLVCETLHASLTRFAGADGFSALLRRALALARQEVPVLGSVKIGKDCRMEGLEELAADEHATEAAIALAANLLDLLITFIGEPLTLKLVREAWPGVDLNLHRLNRGPE